MAEEEEAAQRSSSETGKRKHDETETAADPPAPVTEKDDLQIQIRAAKRRAGKVVSRMMSDAGVGGDLLGGSDDAIASPPPPSYRHNGVGMAVTDEEIKAAKEKAKEIVDRMLYKARVDASGGGIEGFDGKLAIHDGDGGDD